MRSLSKLFLAFLLLLFACKAEDKELFKVFKYNQASGITSLDPAFAKDQANIWLVSQLFNGLVQLDKDLNVQASIAKSWTYSNSGKTLTFTLRDDVYFQESEVFPNGTRRLVAQDFVYSLSRIIDPKVASPGAWIFQAKLAENNAFVALNDTLFQINLAQAFAPILGILSMPYCYAVPKEAIDYYAKDFRAHPVGTGAFQLKLWEEGTALVALKNPNYFEKDSEGHSLPYLDGFKVSFVESKKMEFLNFMNGDLDMISGVDKSFINEILDDKANLNASFQENFELYKGPFLNTEYLGFNLSSSNPWVQKKEFRQALNLCFNKNELIQYLRKGIGAPARNGFIPQGLPPFNETVNLGYAYNPDSAKLLLDRIQYDGSELVLHTNENYKDIALYLANEAEKVGVKLKIEVVQSSLLREWMLAGQVDFFRASWIADYPDAENYLSLFYSQNGAPPNYTRFNNEHFDLLYEKAIVAESVVERLSYYTQMDSILIEEAPVVFLYYDEIIRLSSKDFEAVSTNASNALDIKYIKVKQ
ncbi:MAG: ABC transporter substrate-binding protein [Bacteroidetes bacterium]|nr:ABC transporter substrate-binding protein [Bacteroidota bacterium]